jgi:hypothetical protein
MPKKGQVMPTLINKKSEHGFRHHTPAATHGSCDERRGDDEHPAKKSSWFVAVTETAKT